MKKTLVCLMIILLSVTAVVTAAGQQEDGITTITFGDVSWDSVQVHNRIMAFIIENGLDGYEANFIAGDTLPIINGIVQGDVDVDMESWHSNFPEVYAEGSHQEISSTLAPTCRMHHSWWVPRYLVEGPDAQASGLKSVADLPKYADLFTDPEDRSKGLVYGGVAGWSQLIISEEIYKENGLEETFNLGIAGSGAALAGTMVGAYTKGEPWVGYYWAPTAVLGKLDMVRLPGSEYEAAKVNILVGKTMPEKAPEVIEILKKYSTTVDQNNEFLAAMSDNNWSSEETARWFLENKQDIWTKWVSADIASRVKAAL